jgi:hypothetical protein
MHLKFSERTDYIFEPKNANICVKNMFLTIFVKKSFFFRVKKKFEGNFLVEITKKIKNDFTA